MKIRAEDRRKARTIWQAALTENEIPDFHVLKKFVSEMIASRSRNKEQILFALRERITLFLNGVKIRITSAEELDEAERQRILDCIRDGEKFLTEPEFALDSSLIAGMKIEKGYEILDRSLAKQLDSVWKKMLGE